MHNLVESRTIGSRVFTDIDIAPMGLGGLTNGATVLEMAAAYAAFPNRGVYHNPAAYSRVTRIIDGIERVEIDNTRGSSVAMREETAFYMNHSMMGVIYQTNAAIGAGTGIRAQFPVGHSGRNNIQIAGKTGTSQSDRDRYFVGYTPYYTAAVWFGFDTPMEIRLEEAFNPALTMWREVMWQIHEGLPPANFFTLPGAVSVTVCAISGMLPGDACRHDPRWNDAAFAVGGMYNLIIDGEVQDVSGNARAPRTAIGVTADGTITLYTADGRRPGHSAGLTLRELAERMAELGCVTAFSLDGGGSTTMFVRLPEEDTARLINRPSDGSMRRCADFILLTAPPV
jgi:membrane peptidoglycan carboxypeptidase